MILLRNNEQQCVILIKIKKNKTEVAAVADMTVNIHNRQSTTFLGIQVCIYLFIYYFFCNVYCILAFINLV